MFGAFGFKILEYWVMGLISNILSFFKLAHKKHLSWKICARDEPDSEFVLQI